MNYFELFDIPMHFIVDKNVLAQKYFHLQKKFHPDFFVNATEDEQTNALEQSSKINKALKTLKDTDETIKYILQLKGLIVADEKYQLPPLFLMEVMELNETVSQKSDTQIKQLKTAIYNPVKNIIENFTAQTTMQDLLKVKEYYFKKKYLQRILDRIVD